MGKYLSTANCNKFSKSIFDAKIKEKELADKSNISNLVKNPDLNIKLESLATKAELNTDLNQTPNGASSMQRITQLLRSINKLETIINIKSNFCHY